MLISVCAISVGYSGGMAAALKATLSLMNIEEKTQAEPRIVARVEYVTPTTQQSSEP